MAPPTKSVYPTMHWSFGACQRTPNPVLSPGSSISSCIRKIIKIADAIMVAVIKQKADPAKQMVDHVVGWRYPCPEKRPEQAAASIRADTRVITSTSFAFGFG